MSTPNSTHRKRLARAYANQHQVPYTVALDRVIRAAQAGLLPSRLNDDGMTAALRVLGRGEPGDTFVRDQVPGPVFTARRASDPRDQDVYDASAEYEHLTGSQGLMYISSPGSGSDKYVFGGPEAKVCLGRNEALEHALLLVAKARAHAHLQTPPPSSPTPQAEQTNPGAGDNTGVGDPDRLYLVPTSLLLLRQVWQGRVAWEQARAGGRFSIDNKTAPVGADIELRWLLTNGYIEAPALSAGDDWVVARTTGFGDEVLTAHGADVDKFKDGLPE